MSGLLRAARWTLRQKRYATLAVALWALMLVCVAAGTFELHRYLDKRNGNEALRRNVAAAATPLTPAFVPLTGRGSTPDALAIRYRTVRVSGVYLKAQTRYVAEQSLGGNRGDYVLTPLRTATGDLLVVRGFVPDAALHSTHAPAPPAGVVHIAGRLQTATSAIDPTAYATRLGTPVYQAYVTANAHAAGTAGLHAIPRPGLSNPTGGASEWQLLSYVVQWYIFALLLLIAPFLFARAEVRATQRRFLGFDDTAEQFDLAATETTERRSLGETKERQTVAVRGAQTLAQRDPAAAARLIRAQRLADRYGRPLGPDPERAATAPVDVPVSRDQVVRDSTNAAYRAADDYHAAYNDYLWQLALADGNIPQVTPRSDDPPQPSDREPRVIEGDPTDAED